MLDAQPELWKDSHEARKPLRRQLLKWIGNKQRFAQEIISYFPKSFNVYREPFLGSGAVLGSLAPTNAVGSDIFAPLIEIWQALKQEPQVLIKWYTERWNAFNSGESRAEYEKIRSNYNASPNGADLLFLSRSCYGGVVRFRQNDGFMSTPCGAHKPITPSAFEERVEIWSRRVQGSVFRSIGFEEAMNDAKSGDVIYCDPPYAFSQRILYGAQAFSLHSLFEAIEHCKSKGVYVVLSIDGSKKSGNMLCDVEIPKGLFSREISISVGRSMLKRFQMSGKSLEAEQVADRLLLTYSS